MANAIKDWIQGRVEEYTESEPDGVQNAQSNVWTSVNRVKQKASGSTTSYTSDNVETAIHQLVDEGDLVVWNGLLAPGTEEHVRTLIENEVEASFARPILVGQLNRHIQEVREDEADGSSGDVDEEEAESATEDSDDGGEDD